MPKWLLVVRTVIGRIEIFPLRPLDNVRHAASRFRRVSHFTFFRRIGVQVSVLHDIRHSAYLNSTGTINVNDVASAADRNEPAIARDRENICSTTDLRHALWTFGAAYIRHAARVVCAPDSGNRWPRLTG